MILLLIRIILSVVFAMAGIGKLLDLSGAEKSVKNFGVPEKLAKSFAIALPVGELLLAFLLLFTNVSWLGALGGAVLLAVFIAAMIRQMRLGNAPDCHCFGAIHSEPVSKKSLTRNLVLALLALILVFSGWKNQGLSFAELTDQIALELIFGLALTALLGAAIFYLKKISEQQSELTRRIEVLDVAAREGVETTRADFVPPASGLPIGAPAPDFVLPGLDGREMSFENLLSFAKPFVLIFVSPSCNPCAALLPELINWQNQLRDKLEIVFISSGDPQRNLDKFESVEKNRVLLQKDRETGELFGALWTPTAVLINPDGTIGSHLAVGDAQIREIFEQIAQTETHEGMIYLKNENGAKFLGENIPDFLLPELNGETFSPENLKGKKTLITYWGLDCGWCAQLLPELRDWNKAHSSGDAPELLIVSNGDAERLRKLDLQSKVLLDKDGILLKMIGMTGTPSAILTDENGRIVSEVAVGAENIWNLLGKS